MRKTLSDTGVAALKHRASRYTIPTQNCAGTWFASSTPGHVKSFATVAPMAGRQAAMDNYRPDSTLTIKKASIEGALRSRRDSRRLARL